MSTNRSIVNPNVFLGLLFGVLLIITLGSLFKFGPYYSQETIHYFEIAKGNPEGLQYFYPFYPFLLAIFSSYLFSLYDVAFMLVVLIFFAASYILFRVAYQTYKSPSVFLFLCLGISLLSWWSFQVIASAHADGIFYLAILAWIYLFIYGDKKTQGYYWTLGTLSVLIVWINMNSLFLIPFLATYMIISKNKNYGFLLGAIFLSYALFLFIVPENNLANRISGYSWEEPMGMQHLILFYQNMVSFGMLVPGIFISEWASNYMPNSLSFLLAVIMLAIKLYFLIFAREKIGTPTYLLLLFATVYWLTIFSFQQISGLQDINFSTLFPYLISISWALWLELIVRDKKGLVLLVCFMMVVHSITGHIYTWQNGNQASLSDVKNFEKSAVKIKLGEIIEDGKLNIISDEPDKLSLVFSNMSISQISQDKRSNDENLVNTGDQNQQDWKKESENAVLSGNAVLVLFQADQHWKTFSDTHQLHQIEDNGVWICYNNSLPQ